MNLENKENKTEQKLFCDGVEHPKILTRPLKLKVITNYAKDEKGNLSPVYEDKEIKGQIEQYCAGCGQIIYKGSRFLRKPINSIYKYKADHWHFNDFYPLKFYWVEHRKKKIKK